MGTLHDRLLFGLSTGGGPFAIDELTATADAVGRPLDWVLWYEEFDAAPPVDAVRAVCQLGARPVITWEPWRWDARPAPLMHLLHVGVYDEHVRHWARELCASGVTVDLRFGHEFNGHWYPWSPSAGTEPARYIQVWRRLHDIFTQEGATGVRWMWSPNAGLPSSPRLEQWYPGDEYVDLIGVDGYNWGTTRDSGGWIEPADLFDETLEEIRTFAGTLPVVIAEVACAEAGGCKANWIGALVDYLSARPEVVGFIWFDHDKETDWRITSSPESTSAMAAALHHVTADREDCGVLT
ncbi:glycoside hydrolase family 26 protein [Mycolicibacterium pyrenivorans]|uniref:glycoside hydrolase family 26 protein n=1 Tax=Mycolicibacterium pyrenivorans TaxID=187102 RepID=UPI0021F2B620|nr:glycosyl hydrolase [Mycolicibacterium pyrenivorans]